ncbi:uncharacterized protein LOC134345439 isoform X2 [Mobula hypostoma]|uniref:uncharacterized protein LOC134345439 isoform X2 n=1 Tax=Mobula hypostoma TaxID=723540 RepID=UPI002FC31FDD
MHQTHHPTGFSDTFELILLTAAQCNVFKQCRSESGAERLLRARAAFYRMLPFFVTVKTPSESENKTGGPSRALDIGCAVGRASFELARVFQEVVGIDFSHPFVNACNQLKEQGQLPYTAITEGDLGVQHTAVVPQDIERSRCLFRQGDACNLPEDLGTFDCVLAGNLICRLPDPFAFLHRLPGLVAPGGILVITSPYTWLEEFTPKSLWLGGYKDNTGKEVRGFDTLKQVVSPHFELLSEKNESILIRQTARQHELTVTHVTIWRRGTC